MAESIPAPICATCSFYYMPKRECRHSPPKVELWAPEEPNPLSGKLERMKPMQPTSYFAPQHPDSWCGQHPQRVGGGKFEDAPQAPPLMIPKLDLIKGIT
jgi:hypothetical protein